MYNKLKAVILGTAIFAATAFSSRDIRPIPTGHGHQNRYASSIRYYNKDPYQILDTEGFCLYYRYVQEAYTPGKGLVKTDEYFFSTDQNSAIQRLTIENLKSAFPDNHRFHYSIDGYFRSNRELMTYDPYARCYKLKYLYSLSLK